MDWQVILAWANSLLRGQLYERFRFIIIAGPRGYSKARYTKRLQNIQKTCQRSQKVLALFCIDARPLEKGMKACQTQK